ncbi:flagellar biosynthesis protein FlhB [Beijerinckiaceae bacterium]|nr:flagellar biosynthesis protein FlhB [Beijerinckiaceae bacterium]
MEQSADKDSRTEEATEKKISDETERGNLPVSREAATFATIVAMLAVAVFMARDFLKSTSFILEQLSSDPTGWSLQTSVDAVSLFKVLAWEIARLLIPVFSALLAAGLASNFLQHPPRIVFDRIRPDPKRISLVNGWHRIFSARGQLEFIKSVCKLMLISVMIFILFQWQRNNLIDAMAMDPDAIPELILMIATRLLAIVCVATIVLLAVDLLWVRAHWRRDIRMSKQEIKEEFKQIEGDPLMKARLRSLALDRRRKSMIAAVPRATLVIANPTHYAIALRYIREEGGAPLVLSKGKDLVALKIRELAEKHSIPIVEDKALARSMYDSVEIDRSIPPEFYKAVAELIHILYAKSRGKTAIK